MQTPTIYFTIDVKPFFKYFTIISSITKKINFFVAYIGTCYNSGMKISELGEFGLIDRLSDLIGKTKLNPFQI